MQLTYAESSCAIWMLALDNYIPGLALDNYIPGLALDNYIPGQALRQHDGSTFIPK